MVNILVADDNESNIYVLEMLIEQWFEENNVSSFNLDSASNGQEVVNKVETTNYDLIFLDIMMPVLDGFEALEIIRNKNLLIQPKVIVASAIIDCDENKKQAKNLKANAFIVKPLSYDTINIMLTKYLKNKNISNTSEVKNSTKYIYFDNDIIAESNTLSAIKFLEEYPSNILDNEDIEELIQRTNNLEHNINFSAELGQIIDEFKEILEKSRIMLLSFSEFENLSILINEIKNFVNKLDIQNIENKSQFSQQLLDITELLSSWFEQLFIKKELEDVLEINQSISKSFKILKEVQ